MLIIAKEPDADYAPEDTSKNGFFNSKWIAAVSDDGKLVVLHS
jgi:hypothetical protein